MPEPGSGILRAPPSPPPTFAGSGSTLQRDPRSRCRWPIEFLYPTGCRDLPTPHAPPVSAPALTLLASTNSSSAWTAAASLSGSPESIRDSSATRSEPSSKAALARPAGTPQLDPLGPGRAGLVQVPALNLHHDPLHAQLAQFRLDHRSKPRP